jgi:hypothetical protein
MSVDNWGNWADVVRIASSAAPIASYSAPYGFNDLDMMVLITALRTLVSSYVLVALTPTYPTDNWQWQAHSGRRACTLRYLGYF